MQIGEKANDSQNRGAFSKIIRNFAPEMEQKPHNTKNRLSNIELLRIVAIVLIVMMHAIGCALQTTNAWNRVGVTAINAVGNMGVTVFVLISGFFGIHFRWSRLFALWSIAWFYAVLTFIVDLLTNNAVLSIKALYEAFTPVTSQKWWFLTCYVILYCLSPYLNKTLDALSKRQTETLLAVMVFFFILSPTLLRHTLTNDMEGKGLPNMITAYLMGRYMALYGLPQLFVRHSGKLFVAAALLVFSGSYVAGSIVPTATIFLCKDNNLLVVIGAIALFCWVQKHPFHSGIANRMATYAFPLYLVNQTVLEQVSPFYMQYIDSGKLWLPYFAALCVVVGVTFVVESLRKVVLGGIIDRICNRIEQRTEPKSIG